MNKAKLNLPKKVIEAELAGYRLRFQAGNLAVLFSAIRFCGNQEIVMPEWVVDAFAKATNRWYSYQCKTLDEAFGVVWPKGKQFEAAKKKHRLDLAVVLDVGAKHKQGRSINSALFKEVGKKHGLSKTVAEEYYASGKRKIANISAPGAKMLGEPFVTQEKKRARATRKVLKLSGIGSNKKR